MKRQGNMWVAGVCLVWFALLTICDTAAARPPARGLWIRSGPPAHAPANGYRRKQVFGFELVFDAGLGVYVAVGMTDVYYHEGYFYRLHGGVWEISLRGVTWEAAGIDRLPPGLQIKAKSIAKLNGNGPNSNAADNAGKSNGAANANAGKPAGAGDANAAKPNGARGANAGKATADGNVNKPTGSADASASKPGNNTAGSVNKPSGNLDSGANKPSAKPTESRKPRPAGKGKRK